MRDLDHTYSPEEIGNDIRAENITNCLSIKPLSRLRPN